MTTREAKGIAERMLKERSLVCTQKFLILGLNRNHPGFGDDAVLVDCQTRSWQPLSGEFRRGTCVSKSEPYRAVCDEHRENGWADEDDEGEWEPGDNLYRELDDEKIDNKGHTSAVTVPEDAKFMEPGTELKVSYCCDDGSPESAAAFQSKWMGRRFLLERI